MTDSVELKGVLEAALSEDGGIILIRNAMAEYQSHKKVHAAVISEVHPCDEHGNFMIDITNPLYDGITIPYMVTPDMVARFTPGVGDYIVLYENDYVSFSPKDVFEGGYLMIEWPPVCASEEDAEMEREIQTLGLTAPRGVDAAEIAECISKLERFHGGELFASIKNEAIKERSRKALGDLKWQLNCLQVLPGGIPKPSHIERMRQEQEQLAERTGKLETFIPSETFKQLPYLERNRMKRQLVAMREYLAVLNERIVAATNP